MYMIVLSKLMSVKRQRMRRLKKNDLFEGSDPGLFSIIELLRTKIPIAIKVYAKVMRSHFT